MEKLESSKTEEYIVNAVKKRIYTGEVKDGYEITQDELAKDLGLSRMPIRGAIAKLKTEGVVTRLSNRHIVANGITKDRAILLAKEIVALEKTAYPYLDLSKIKKDKKEKEIHLSIADSVNNGTVEALINIAARSYLGYFMEKYPNKERVKLLKRALEDESAFDEYLALLLSDIEGSFEN